LYFVAAGSHAIAQNDSPQLDVATPAAAAKQGSGRALLGALQEAFVSVADALEPAVVTITARKTVRGGVDLEEDKGSTRGKQKTFRSQGTGSGVIISPDGWVVTNDHVVGNAVRVMVRLRDGREIEGAVRRDYRSDLAVIKLDGDSYPYARLGDSDRVRIGQWAIAIGSPYKYDGSFSVGVVSALGRKQEIRDQNGEGDGRLYPDMIQTDAAINPGNSGGPLINLDGEVIAINTAIESENGGSVGIGFAIPANQVRFVVEQLKSKGSVSYGYLGVEPETITPRLAAAYKVVSGALVKAEPPAGSPASKAGIHVEDVITKIESTSITSERDFRLTVSRLTPGAEVSITYTRNGAEKTARAIITEPPPLRASQIDTGIRTAGLGVEVAVLNAETASRVGLASSNEGVVIRSMDSSSCISETDIRAGDVILKVNGIPTPTVEAFRKATLSLRPGEMVRILWQGKRYPETIKRISIVTLD
jgi:serine protease Do